jgi:hypothetical protein
MGSSACRFLTQLAYLDVYRDIKLSKPPLSFKVVEKRLPKSLRGLLNLLVLFDLIYNLRFFTRTNIKG